jgi:hypothetical protein
MNVRSWRRNSEERAYAERVARWAMTHRLVVRDVNGAPLVDMPLDALCICLKYADTNELTPAVSIEPL